MSSNCKIPVSSLWRIFLPFFLFVSFILVVVSMTTGTFNDTLRSEKKNQASQSNGKMFLKNVDLMEFPIPASVQEKAKQVVEVNSGRIDVVGVDSFYREANVVGGVERSQQSALLLHGAAFNSKTWLDLNTINLLAAMGHRVVAVDLPGYGETPSSNGKLEDYLQKLIDALHLKNVVIVSPSMSGGYSIPYLIKYSKDLDGYVPIAPVSTQDIVQKASSITTPTLILYGEKDTGLGLSSLKDLSHLPNSKSVVLPNAQHPAYLDQPDMFHQLLYNFMRQVKDHKQS